MELIEFPLLGVIPVEGRWAEALTEATEHIAFPRSLVPSDCTPHNCFVLYLAAENVAPFGIAVSAHVLFQLDAKVEPGNIVAVYAERRLSFARYLPTPDGPMIMLPNATVATTLAEDAQIVAKAVKAIVSL